MSPKSRFEKANQIGREKAGEIGEKCLAVLQTGSSLREEDFCPSSDVDLLTVHKEEPEEKWASDYSREVEVTIMQESAKDFLENLEKGRPFELTALKYGKILKGKGYIQNLKKKEYKPGPFSLQTWLQSALNHYRTMLMDRNLTVEFYNSAYHSYREFSKYLILHRRGKLVEGDGMVKKNLEKIDPQLIANFWGLRGKRFEPPSLPARFIEIDELNHSPLYPQVAKVESIGKRTFQIEGLIFPGVEKIKTELEKRGCQPGLSLSVRVSLKKAHLSGRDKQSGELRMFDLYLETGELKSTNRPKS